MDQGIITATEAKLPAVHAMESTSHCAAETNHLAVVNSACQQLYRVLDDFALICTLRGKRCQFTWPVDKRTPTQGAR